jgi:hypothetical protein
VTRELDGSSSQQESRIKVGSENHAHVEWFYPTRYPFRLRAFAADGRLVGFEDYGQTRRTRHPLYLCDANGTDLRRYDQRKGVGTDVVASVEAGTKSAGPGAE